MAASVMLRSLNRGILSLTRTSVSVRCYVQGDSSKKVDVPPPPKKPLSGYISFLTQKYPTVKQQYPDYNTVQLARTIGSLWKALPEQDKLTFAPNESAKAEYTKTRQAYMQTLTPEQQQALKENAQKKKEKRIRLQKKKVTRSFDKPKKPPNGYILFSRKQMANREGEFKKVSDLVKKIGEEWRTLAPVDKERYQEAAMELQEPYYKELLAWEQKMIEEGHPELVRGYKKPSKPKKKKVAAKRTTKRKTVKKVAKKSTKKVKAEE